MNRSKISEQSFWTKWQESGAISTHPDIIKKQEREAEQWVKKLFTFDFGKVTPESWDRFFRNHFYYRQPRGLRLDSNLVSLEVIQKAQERQRLIGDSHRSGYESVDRDLLKQFVPQLTPEQYKIFYGPNGISGNKFGFTNNLFYFLRRRDSLVKGLLVGEINEPKLAIWSLEGRLFPAFEKVGWRRMQKLIEISESGKIQYPDDLESENTLRALAVALVDGGLGMVETKS